MNFFSFLAHLVSRALPLFTQNNGSIRIDQDGKSLLILPGGNQCWYEQLHQVEESLSILVPMPWTFIMFLSRAQFMNFLLSMSKADDLGKEIWRCVPMLQTMNGKWAVATAVHTQILDKKKHLSVLVRNETKRLFYLMLGGVKMSTKGFPFGTSFWNKLELQSSQITIMEKIIWRQLLSNLSATTRANQVLLPTTICSYPLTVKFCFFLCEL